MRVFAVKRPVPVKNIISSSGNGETQTVGQVFMAFYNFFNKIGNAKIYKHPHKANQAKLDELYYKFLQFYRRHNCKGRNNKIALIKDF